MFPIPRNNRNRPSPRPPSAAYTLVELLIVIALMGIFASLALTRFEPSLHEQLRGAAQVVAADLALGRSLAVANNTQYKYTFDLPRHRYWLEHSGTNPAFNPLPDSPYRDPRDPPTRQTTDLQQLPAFSSDMELVAVRNVSSTGESDTTSVEFGPLGALAQPQDCWIWLAVGRGVARRHIPIELDAITGLARIGELQATGPPPLLPAPASPSPVSL